MGKRGPIRRIIYSKVIRIQLTETRRALLPFFEDLEQLPRGKRAEVLLDAIQHGATAARATLRRKESTQVEHVIDTLLAEYSA